MASLSHCHHSFDIVAARKVARSRRAKAVVIAYPGHDWSGLIDLEFSSHGRDPRFISGWYLAPVMLALLMLIPLAL